MTERPLILPPLRRTAKDAEAFARVVHEGQVDKAGRPYIEHLERVTRRALEIAGRHAYEADRLAQIAWLHDILEPDKRPFGRVWPGNLQGEGFGPATIVRVEALCIHFDGMPYLSKVEYLISQAENLREPCLIYVKIADIEDNSDPERLALLDEPTRERLKAKYGAALTILKEAAARMGWRQGNG